MWPIAGEFLGDSRSLNERATRLKGSDSNADANKEGLRLEMNGGMHGSIKQKALIEFICDRNKTGLEGLPARRSVMRSEPRADNGSDDGDNGEEGGKKEDGSEKEGDGAQHGESSALELVSYLQSANSDGEEVGVLRLEWRTKYACEDIKETDPAPSKGKGGWGFFTWFIIM